LEQRKHRKEKAVAVKVLYFLARKIAPNPLLYIPWLPSVWDLAFKTKISSAKGYVGTDYFYLVNLALRGL